MERAANCTVQPAHSQSRKGICRGDRAREHRHFLKKIVAPLGQRDKISARVTYVDRIRRKNSFHARKRMKLSQRKIQSRHAKQISHKFRAGISLSNGKPHVKNREKRRIQIIKIFRLRLSEMLHKGNDLFILFIRDHKTAYLDFRSMSMGRITRERFFHKSAVKRHIHAAARERKHRRQIFLKRNGNVIIAIPHYFSNKFTHFIGCRGKNDVDWLQNVFLLSLFSVFYHIFMNFSRKHKKIFSFSLICGKIKEKNSP